MKSTKLEQPSNQDRLQSRKAMFLPQMILKCYIQLNITLQVICMPFV